MKSMVSISFAFISVLTLATAGCATQLDGPIPPNDPPAAPELVAIGEAKVPPPPPATPGKLHLVKQVELPGSNVMLGGGRESGIAVGYSEKSTDGSTVLHAAALSEQGDLLFDGMLPNGKSPVSKTVLKSLSLGSRGFFFSYEETLKANPDGSGASLFRTIILDEKGTAAEAGQDGSSYALWEGTLARYGSWQQEDANGLRSFFFHERRPTLGDADLKDRNATEVPNSLQFQPMDLYASRNDAAYYLGRRCVEGPNTACTQYEIGVLMTSQVSYWWQPIITAPEKEAVPRKFVFVVGTQTLYAVWDDRVNHSTRLTQIGSTHGAGLTYSLPGHIGDVIGVGSHVARTRPQHAAAGTELVLETYARDFTLADSLVLMSYPAYWEASNIAATGDTVAVATCGSLAESGGPCTVRSTVHVVRVD